MIIENNKLKVNTFMERNREEIIQVRRTYPSFGVQAEVKTSAVQKEPLFLLVRLRHFLGRKGISKGLLGMKGIDQALIIFLVCLLFFLFVLYLQFALLSKGAGTPEPGSGGFLVDWIAGIFG